MSQIIARSYLSPTLVLLAFDWPDGKTRNDFLGFAIERNPGHGKDGAPDFLWNKIGFGDPKTDKPPHPSDKAPFQKFHWWDSGISSSDRGKTFSYTIYPVVGTGQKDLSLVQGDKLKVDIVVPFEVDPQNDIGTFFNRAVVSSQAFVTVKKENDLKGQMDWLANGLQDAFTSFLKVATSVKCSIYHLTDNRWVIPDLDGISGKLSLSYYIKNATDPDDRDTKDLAADQILKKRGSAKYQSHERTKTSIMHHKFLVKDQGSANAGVLMGSTNFTPEAITVQANLLHTFRSKQMADAYGAQHDLLFNDPTKGETAKSAKWISIDDVKDAKIRLFFSPEPSSRKDGKQVGKRISINDVVNSVKQAKQSVIFCLFSPTDEDLLEAFFAAGDSNKMMFGLLNSIQDPTKPSGKKKIDPEKAEQKPKANYKVVTELFHRSRSDHKQVAFDYFGRQGVTAPEGFLPEFSTIDTSSFDASTVKKPPKPKSGKKSKSKQIPAVHIHHKFIVIDAETDHPTIYTGSANMSNNSTYNNDENLLEIKDCPRLAKTYLAEFMRLYEHYRTRAIWNEEHGKAKAAKTKGNKKTKESHDGFRLKTTRDEWIKDAYKKDSPGWVSRIHLSGAAS